MPNIIDIKTVLMKLYQKITGVRDFFRHNVVGYTSNSSPICKVIRIISSKTGFLKFGNIKVMSLHSISQ